MDAPARPKPLPWDELKSRLDENQPFNMMRNTPYYRDAVYEQFSAGEYARRYAAVRAKMRADKLDCVIVPGGPSHWSFGAGMTWLTGHWEWHSLCCYVLVPLTGEPTMMEQLLPKVQPGMLLLADRGAFSYALWRKASETGADLLWRIRTDRAGPQPSHLEDLPDGSWLAELRRSTGAAERAKPTMMVRVIDYTVEDGREHPSYRLFTTILDPAEATAAELAAAYQRRWEIELAFDELKTHQRGPRMVLRSKSPDLVLQEVWGHLCCHYAIRSLMAEAAVHAGHDPDRTSFIAALRIARATIAHTGDSPP